ncbi:50S ribosomal protein L28 [Candidatus Parcubacteria bacterium]|nr:MAG: 50S ribosomal protein L28 [Candidatus Parcubacteria bacterium]
MAKKCDVCGKGPLSGNNVSHANNKTRMRQLPNLQKVHVEVNGKRQTLRVCTKCIRSNRIRKSA